MMTLVDHLLQNRTPLELARELAATAKQNVVLRDRIGALEHELFWMKVAESTQTERTPEWFRDQYLTTPQPRPE